MAKNNLRVKAFLDAAESIHLGLDDFCCHAINHALNKFTSSRTPERVFFQKLYGISSDIEDRGTFESLYMLSFDGYPDDEEMINIRVMALCFAAEIARLKNNKK